MTGSDAVAVSILIPFHNCRELTEACLRSIAEHTRDISFEVILIDDAGTETPDVDGILGEIPRTLIHNEQRRSFSENNNHGAREARGEYLCLLNNDTLVSPGWLSGMVEVARREPDLGVLGNKHLFPDTNKLHHAGMAVTREGEPLHLHPGTDPDAPAVNCLREVPAVTFACVLIPRAVYEELGGLDEAFRNGYEDVDFCFRAAERGKKILYTPASTIVHFGQSTPGRTDTDNTNRNLYLQRWGGKAPRTYESVMDADRGFNRAVPRSSAAGEEGVHFVLDLSRASAFAWAGVDLVAALRARGVRVSLPPVRRLDASIPPERRRLLRSCFSRTPHRTFHIKWTHYWPEYFRAPLSGEVNAEFFCTNYAYPDPSRPLDLWTRHVLLNENRKLPVSGYNDGILAALGVPAVDRRVVPLGYAPEIETLDPDHARLKRPAGEDLNILLMTNSHDLHRYGTDLAITALAQAFGPDDPVVIHIKDYGAGASGELEQWIAAQPRFPRVVWHRDFLSKDHLIRLYASMDVQLSPFRGEGFAMKILDAMAVGVPCILPLYGGPLEFCTPETSLPVPHREVEVAGGYDRENYYLGEGATWCEVDATALAETLAGLAGNRDRLSAIGEAARLRVRGRFTWDHSAKMLMEALYGWQTRRLVAITPRLGPDERDLSVIVPTRDRPDQLAMTLDGYAAQSLPADRYELVLVNDHGDRPALDAVTQRFPNLHIRTLDNPGPGGPGAARNVGIDRARGGVILITGDDIVPSPDFLRTHLDAHRRQPAETDAFVGTSPWHADLTGSPFLDYLTGEGGQQFKYDDMKDGHPVPFDRFYTSNVSVKRRFLARQDILFSDRYRFAAYEDVELGYRLHLRGMRLHYLKDAVGYHHHALDPRSFLQRQYKVGRMLTVLALQQPSYIPHSHYAWLRMLELLRCTPGLASLVESRLSCSAQIEDRLSEVFVSLLETTHGARSVAASTVARGDLDQWTGWMDRKMWAVWTAANDLMLRKGMADEWAGDHERLARLGREWIEASLLPRLVAGTAPDWDVPLNSDDLLPSSLRQHPFLHRVYRFCIHHPAAQTAYGMLHRSRAGRAVIEGVKHRMGVG